MNQTFSRTFKLLFLLFFICNISLAQEKSLDVGGALRFNYRYKSWDSNSTDVGGDAVLDVFRLNAKASYNKLFLDAEYRFYNSEFGGGMIHHGYIGYKFDAKNQVQIGIHQVPFGLQPYTSHSWFFNVPYYVGLEDDYDTGLKYIHTTEKWDFAFAWYKNAEGSRTWNTFSDGSGGYGVDPARYSYDLAGDLEETGQVNVRLARKFNDQEIGFSAQYGKYINHVSDETMQHSAAAIHYNGNFLSKKQLNVKAQATAYSYENTTDGLMTMAAYNYTYDIASEALILCGGVAYTLPVDFGPIESVQFYDNYSYMAKSGSDFNDTQMNVLGMLVVAGPIYTYIDYASGKNQDWLGPWGAFGENGDQYGFGKGAENPEWHSWFNINVGYYF
jgi:hypothetical protein